MDTSELPLWQRRNWSTEVSTAPQLLADLADDADEDVRVGVAQNVWTPPDVLARLAGDRSARVRAGVAGNRMTPPEVQDRLAGEPTIESDDEPPSDSALDSGSVPG